MMYLQATILYQSFEQLTQYICKHPGYARFFHCKKETVYSRLKGNLCMPICIHIYSMYIHIVCFCFIFGMHMSVDVKAGNNSGDYVK